MRFFSRQYRLAIGRPGAQGFEVGRIQPGQSEALHIRFIIEKADTDSPNGSRISVWNLSKPHLDALEAKDALVALRAGYGSHMPVVFTGQVVLAATALDGTDRITDIEALDGRVALRDTYVSNAYAGPISTRKIIEDGAAEMGVPLTLSYNAQFATLEHGFSCVGRVAAMLDKACAPTGLAWQIQNGVLQVKAHGDTMSREVYVLSSDSGLIGIPRRISIGAETENAAPQLGWEVDYLLNGAINVSDYVRLEAKAVMGYFRVHSVAMYGDNLEGDWICTAKLLEAK